MESVIKNVWEVNIVNNETECAKRIVYETGTHKAVVVCGRAGGCFISLNEVSRLPWLILAFQSMKDKVLWYGFSTVHFILGIGESVFQNMTGIFEVCHHSCKTGESVSHLSAIMVGENLEGHN